MTALTASTPAVAPTRRVWRGAGTGVAVGIVAAAGCVVAQWPLWGSGDGTLVVGNVLVTVSFAVAAVFVGRDRRHLPTRLGLAAAGCIWPLNWVNAWQVGVWPLVAALVGPAAALCAVWAMLRYPVRWRSRGQETAVVAVLICAQAAADLPVLLSVPQWHGLPASTLWLTLRPDYDGFRAATLVYDVGGAAVALTGAAGIIIRLLLLRGRDRQVMRPVMVACVFAGLYAIASNLLAALSPSDALLHASYVGQQLAYVLIPVTLAISAVWRWSMQDEVVSLGWLAGDATPAEVRTALRTLLGDPELDVLYLVKEHLVDVDGRPEPAPAEGTTLTTVDVPSGARVVVVTRAAGLGDYRALVEAALSAAALAVDNSALQAELASQIIDVATSADRVGVALEAERRAVEARVAGIVARHLNPVDRSLRQLAPATTQDVTPLIYDLDSVRAALRRLAAGAGADVTGGLASSLTLAVRRLAPHALLDVDPHLPDLPAALEQAAYLAVTELVTNSVKHGGAVGLAVTVRSDESRITVVVCDEGPGGADPASIGLAGVRRRVEEAGGSFQLTSPPHSGTVARVVLDHLKAQTHPLPPT